MCVLLCVPVCVCVVITCMYGVCVCWAGGGDERRFACVCGVCPYAHFVCVCVSYYICVCV